MIAEEVTKTLFSKAPELASGIANVEFGYDNDGDGFKVMTNEGQSYSYYPAINKVFTHDALYTAQKALEIKDPKAATEASYAFVSPSDFSPGKKQLIKYIRRDNTGGPEEQPYFLSILNRKEAPKLTFQWGGGLVWSFSILTPEGGYFEPEVLYHDAQYVLFQSNTTAAKEAPTSLHCIDVNTGATLFTLPFSERKYFDEAIRYKDGFVVKSNNAMFLVATKGNLIKEYKTI